MLRNAEQQEPFVLAAGGAWKSSSFLFQSFSEQLKVQIPSARIRKPVFEPVMGGVILSLLEKQEGDATERLEELKKEFPQFLIRNWEKEEINVN